MDKALAIGMVLLLLGLAVVAHAQLGEVAGPLSFNVSIGSSQTLNYTIVNAGNNSINFYIKDAITSTIKNETTPTITASPMNGTILPHQQYSVKIDVSMPSGDKPGLLWQGTLQALESTNVTAPGGAVIQTGVLKGITVMSSQRKGLPLYYVGAFVAVVVVIGVSSYIIYGRRRKGRKGSQSATTFPSKERGNGTYGKPSAPSISGKGKRRKSARSSRTSSRTSRSKTRRKQSRASKRSGRSR